MVLQNPNINIEPFDILTPPAYVSLVLADTSVTAYQISPGNTARIRKIMVTNRTGGNGFLRLGYTNAAAAFVQVFPDILIINGVDMEITEDQIPEYWYRETGYALADIIARVSVTGAAPTDVQLFLEVLEKGAQ